MVVFHPCYLLHGCRTERIRWKYAVQYFLEFVFTIVVLVMCLKNFIRPSLEMIPSNPAKWVPPHVYTGIASGSLWGGNQRPIVVQSFVVVVLCA